MATRLPVYLSKLTIPRLTTIPRITSSSNKENRLKFSLRPRAKKGVQSEVTVIELNLCSPVSKQKYCCVLCQSLLRDPCQVTCCGSNYCKDCIDRLSATSGKCANKNCRKNYSVITDGAMVEDLGRKIMQLKVYCILKNSGCKWVGTIEELESSHFVGADYYDKDDPAACQFQYVNCPNECGTRIPRGKVTEHRFSECDKELSVCKYCGVEDSNIRKVHQRMCPSVPVECPNKCAVLGIARSQILFHLENACPQRLVSCKYRHVGCEEQVRFVDLDEHNIISYQKHLDLMSEKLEFVSNENDELRGDNDSHQKNATLLLSKLSDFQSDVASAKDILGCISDMKSSDNVYSASSLSPLSIDTLIGELPQAEDDVSIYDSVIRELSSRISAQKERETPPESITPELSGAQLSSRISTQKQHETPITPELSGAQLSSRISTQKERETPPESITPELSGAQLSSRVSTQKQNEMPITPELSGAQLSSRIITQKEHEIPSEFITLEAQYMNIPARQRKGNKSKQQAHDPDRELSSRISAQKKHEMPSESTNPEARYMTIPARQQKGDKSKAESITPEARYMTIPARQRKGDQSKAHDPDRELSAQKQETPPKSINPEAPYMNIPARWRKGDKSKLQARDPVYELLPDVCADTPRSRCLNERRALSPVYDKPKRRSSEPNFPDSAKKKAARSASVPKEKESNVELLVYRQFNSELSLQSISEGNCNKSCPESASKNLKDGNVSRGVHSISEEGNCDKSCPASKNSNVSRGVTFQSQVEVISDMVFNLGHDTTTTSPTSGQEWSNPVEVSEEDDVFAPQVDDKSRSTSKIHVVDSPPGSKQHGDGVRSRSSVHPVTMRPRSMVISAPSFSSYSPKISKAVRSRCHSSGSPRRVPPLPPKTSPSSLVPLTGLNYKSLFEAVPNVEPNDTEPPATDVGPTAVSVQSPQSHHRKTPKAQDSDSISPPSSRLRDFADFLPYQAPKASKGSSRSEVSSSSSVSSHDRSRLLPRPDRLFSIPASMLHRSLEQGSTNSLPIHDMGDVREEMNKVFVKRSMHVK